MADMPERVEIPPKYHGEFYFLKLMADEIEKEYTPGEIFRHESQLHVNRKFRSLFTGGSVFSDRCLKSRFKRIKQRYLLFSELLSHEGIFWNKKHNILHGNEDILREKCEKYATKFGYRGEENFDLMRQIFESGVAFK